MARFQAELPLELMREIQQISDNSGAMMEEMLTAAAEVVHDEIENNLNKSFKTTGALRKGLKITKIYRVRGDDSINIKLGFYGYDPDKKSARYPNGVPIPLIAQAREYGTSSGEAKRPFFRRAFKRAKIEAAMQRVQDKYIKGD